MGRRGICSTVKSTFRDDICVTNVNLGHVTRFSWSALSLRLTRVKHHRVSSKHELQVACVRNGKMRFKQTAWRFGNWIPPRSVRRQTCEGGWRRGAPLKAPSPSAHGVVRGAWCAVRRQEQRRLDKRKELCGLNCGF